MKETGIRKQLNTNAIKNSPSLTSLRPGKCLQKQEQWTIKHFLKEKKVKTTANVTAIMLMIFAH